MADTPTGNSRAVAGLQAALASVRDAQASFVTEDDRWLSGSVFALLSVARVVLEHALGQIEHGPTGRRWPL